LKLLGGKRIEPVLGAKGLVVSARCIFLVCRPASVVREYKASACQACALLLIRLRMSSRLQFVSSASAVVQNTCIVDVSCVHASVFRSSTAMLAKWFAPADD
jgi:hypothetical protein